MLKNNTMAKKENKDIEVIKPKVVKAKKPKGEKYTVLLPYETGTGDSRKEYKPGDTVHYTPGAAKQFINAFKIKKQ